MIAEKLENAGLWRRAAARWLDVMQICKTETERDWISLRRRYCLSMSSPPRHSPKLDIKAINQAATITQEKMGIRLEKGIQYRKYPECNKK
ncbi:TPA: ANR family transcriptional regulator [Citrobacter freundii]|nr:ANR family transcriptional regulator [Citrobacter freundii]